MRYITQTAMLCGMLLPSACDRPARPAEIAKAEPVLSETASASQALAEARCTRESRCNNVGADKRYSSFEDCVARVWTEWEGDFDGSRCQSGVDPAALEQCLTEIRVLECSSPFESLEQIQSCQANRVCPS